MLHIWQLCEIIHLFVASDHFPSRHEWFEALVKVVHAHTCVDYCQDNEDDCQNSEDCEGSLCRFVLVITIGLINADQFKKEIGESGMVKDDVDNHANLDFPPCPDCSHGENNDGDWDGCNGQIKFAIRDPCNNDEELNCKPQEEEEIKL